MTEPSETPKGHSGAIIAYAFMILGTVGLFLVVRWYGLDLTAPIVPGMAKPGAASAHASALPHILLALGVIIAVARGLGWVFGHLHQPPVIGEVVAGILLGPSLLGRLAPDVQGYLLPRDVAPFLSILAQVGVILYMFLVGLELDLASLRRRTHATVAISHASIIAPFLLGSALALYVYPRLSTSDVKFTQFALFMGVSMSVTAFPVLARILTDRKIHTTHLGVVALTCAAVDDVTAWCLLALVVSVVQAEVAGALFTFGLTIGYIAAMYFLVRPVVARYIRARDGQGLTRGVMSVVCVTLLASALATEFIGIHAIFGAFFLGAIVPPSSRIARELLEKLEDLVVVLLLPAFFAFTGMRTQIGLVSGASDWILCGLIILVATAGKFGGSFVAARIAGIGWRDSASLGILMNTRGLMELIVLNLGLDLGVIGPRLFAMLVIMAVVTTFATTPILDLIQGRSLVRGAVAEKT
jgi:Kef-type K+ transport system membrane component KefB